MKALTICPTRGGLVNQLLDASHPRGGCIFMLGEGPPYNWLLYNQPPMCQDTETAATLHQGRFSLNSPQHNTPASLIPCLVLCISSPLQCSTPEASASPHSLISFLQVSL